ncbi:hypothetical protein MVES_000247 [Malassezia vespertilionis]|uniref:Uncharacterized protein n=1 Tax=Malassezia vespertilionis TaxID=2020962 RepID=A0A2N1JGM7_9BASI|nr:hypothetical protein MVES_000247 [Malassezia vespertilionis]
MSDAHAAPRAENDDSVPFLLTCIISRAEFRPTYDHEVGIYVWPTMTLREVANILYAADPRISRPLSPHDFRVVYKDQALGRYDSHAPVHGVTRTSKQHIDALLDPKEEEGVRAILRRVDRMQQEAQDRRYVDPAWRTLESVGVAPGNVLECVVRREGTRTPRDTRRELSPDTAQNRRGWNARSTRSWS